MSKPTIPSSISLSSNFTPKTPFKLHLPTATTLSKTPSIITSTTLSSHSPNPPQFPPKPLTFLSILKAVPNWADHINERGMKKNISLYYHEKWVLHRSSLRHIRHLLSSLSSRVILSLIPPVIAFTAVAFVIAVYNFAVESQFLPLFSPVLRASYLPYQLTAPALALLLVFRTEASFSQFEESKNAWTKVVSGTCDFAASVDGSGSDSIIKKAILKYIMAFPVALKVLFVFDFDFGMFKGEEFTENLIV